MDRTTACGVHASEPPCPISLSDLGGGARSRDRVAAHATWEYTWCLRRPPRWWRSPSPLAPVRGRPTSTPTRAVVSSPSSLPCLWGVRWSDCAGERVSVGAWRPPPVGTHLMLACFDHRTAPATLAAYQSRSHHASAAVPGRHASAASARSPSSVWVGRTACHGVAAAGCVDWQPLRRDATTVEVVVIGVRQGL